MQFKSCEPFSLDERLIEISSSGRVWDLHNAAELNSISYNIEDRAFDLSFSYYLDDGKEIKKCVLSFQDVFSFAISSRDPEMPFFEDVTLDFLELIDEKRIILKFCGGMAINICCSILEFKLL